MSDIREALGFIPADDRDTWVRMAMAVKSVLGEGGYTIWDDWSQQADSYRQQDAKAVWRSVRSAGGVTVNSLYREARDRGWKGGASRPELSFRDHAAARARRDAEVASIRSRHAEAAVRAASILKECEPGQHQYLASKGFPAELGLIWSKSIESPRLVIPMRIGRQLSTLQVIQEDGSKKFLAGGRASGAQYALGTGDLHVIVEGYATGLSVRAAMQASGLRPTVHVAFSAGNMIKIARSLPRGLVIADHDANGVGEDSAKKIGWRYWMSPVVGEDANDFHRRLGLYALREQLRREALAI